jgi:hypothetical protein
MLATNVELARQLAQLEAKYDEQFRVVFDAIRELMSKPEAGSRRQLGLCRRKAPLSWPGRDCRRGYVLYASRAIVNVRTISG